ncbi:10040_t:CDS:1, partial [Dentiscutata heterogama]
DNRRLFHYREAIRRGANFTLVPVQIVRESDESCEFRWKHEKSL